MSTTAYTGLTGSGLQGISASGANLVLRLEITDPGPAGSLFPFGDPQRYGGLGWIAPYDFIPSGFDGVIPHDLYCLVNPIVWFDTLQIDLDWTQLQADLYGVSGFAYALSVGVSLDVYVTSF